MFRIPSDAIHHGDAAMCLLDDTVGDLLPFRREDEKLCGLTVGIDHHISDIGDDKGDHQTIYYGRYASLDSLGKCALEGE